MLAVNYSFATGRPDLIDHGLTAAAYRCFNSFNNGAAVAVSFLFHDKHGAPELPDQLLPPPTR